MGEKEKAKKIVKILNKIYPKAPVPLKHKNNSFQQVSTLPASVNFQIFKKMRNKFAG